MPQYCRYFAVALISSSLLAACAPLTPQRSLDLKPKAQLEAAARVALFSAGDTTQPPAGLTVIGPVEAHSCQFWEFTDPASIEDAIKRLQFEAMAKGADGIIELSHGKDERNRWANRCWTSFAARGTAVKFSAPMSAAAAAPAAALPASSAAAIAKAPAAASTTITASGEGRPELMDWIRRLAIPRGNFIARGPGDGNLDWIGVDAEIGAWQVQLPRSTGSASASSKLTDSGLALEPGVSRLTLSSRQLGYDMSASWTYSSAGTWEMGDRLLRRLTE